MDPGGNPDPLIVPLLLSGDPGERNEGLCRAHAAYQLAVMGRVRHRYPGLTPQDLGDVWQQTLIALIDRVLGGLFRAGTPLEALLWTVASRRAADVLRRRGHRAAPLTLLDAVAAALPARGDTTADGPLLEGELRGLIRDAVARLPDLQRLVLCEYFANYPESDSPAWLSAHLSTVSGTERSAPAVKGLVKRGLRVVRAHVERAGYQLGYHPTEGM